jgi:hypothetical protein
VVFAHFSTQSRLGYVAKSAIHTAQATLPQLNPKTARALLKLTLILKRRWGNFIPAALIMKLACQLALVLEAP